MPGWRVLEVDRADIGQLTSRLPGLKAKNPAFARPNG
jgi:hypothetical protein